MPSSHELRAIIAQEEAAIIGPLTRIQWLKDELIKQLELEADAAQAQAQISKEEGG